MRTSIREPSNGERKTIVVPDRPLAEYLQERFPGSRVHKLDAGIIEDTSPGRAGRPRKHQSNRERVAEQRARRKEQRVKVLADLLSLNSPHDASEQIGCGDDGGADPTRNRRELRAEKGIKAITHFGTLLSSASFFRAVTSPTAFGYLEDHGDVDFFVDALKTFHRRQLPSKEENYLIAPAIFDPSRGIKKRRRENIVYLRHVWLDFENGDLRPDELAALFPNVRLITVNTFHHTSEKPRFRAIIPTDRPLNPDGYELLFDNVACKIEEAGYWIDRKKKGSNGHAAGKLRAGLDMAMRTPTSLFYLPSQAADPGHSFFIDYNEPGREVLNPIPWIENSVVPIVPSDEPPPWPETPRTKINEGLVQRATGEWRAAAPQQGNREFFRFGLRLRRAGLSHYEVETTLNAEAGFGRSPNERIAQVKSIMTSLLRSWRRHEDQKGRRGAMRRAVPSVCEGRNQSFLVPTCLYTCPIIHPSHAALSPEGGRPRSGLRSSTTSIIANKPMKASKASSPDLVEPKPSITCALAGAVNVTARSFAHELRWLNLRWRCSWFLLLSLA